MKKNIRILCLVMVALLVLTLVGSSLIYLFS